MFPFHHFLTTARKTIDVSQCSILGTAAWPHFPSARLTRPRLAPLVAIDREQGTSFSCGSKKELQTGERDEEENTIGAQNWYNFGSWYRTVRLSFVRQQTNAWFHLLRVHKECLIRTECKAMRVGAVFFLNRLVSVLERRTLSFIYFLFPLSLAVSYITLLNSHFLHPLFRRKCTDFYVPTNGAKASA